MKRISVLFFLLAMLLSACGTSSLPADQPNEVTPAPYSPDTPSPPGIDAPLVEAPALVSIQFINSLDGWGVTETQVVRTNDGGITWYSVSPPGVTEAGYSVYVDFLDAGHAWVQVPDYDNYPNGGTLYRTTDGGITWVSNSSPFSTAEITFLDPDNGWALAGLGVAAGSNAVAIYQSKDGGVTWTQKYVNNPTNASASGSLPFGGLKSGIAPLDMETAWVYGVTYSMGTPYLFRTDDGGRNWTEVVLPLPEGSENSELGIEPGQMKFVSSEAGFIAMRLTSDISRLAVYVTQDGGTTWTLTPTLILDGGSADFMSAEGMVIYNGQQFYVTHDSARTWSIIPPDVKFGEIFAGMDFVDPSTGWLVTLDLTNQRSLYRTNDGGATWFPVAP